VSCKLTSRFVAGYLDGELDLSRTIEMETHLQSCGDCARELERQQALRAALQRSSLAYAAPAALRLGSRNPPRTRKRRAIICNFAPAAIAKVGWGVCSPGTVRRHGLAIAARPARTLQRPTTRGGSPR